MPFQIPDVIEGTDDAREAVVAFLREVADPMFLWRGLLQQPFTVARNVMAELNADPAALGPVLRVAPRNGEAYLVGRSKPVDGRGLVTVALPSADPPSKKDPAAWGSVPSKGPVVPYELAEVTAAVAISYALAERCSAVADVATEDGGRRRQVGLLRDEAGELETFAVRLEDTIPDLAERWRIAAEQKSPSRRQPANKPVTLR